MTSENRFLTYLQSLDRGNTKLLDQIEEEALAEQVPIIRKEMQGLLKFLLALKKPKKILEVGTAVGFSAILLLTYAPEGAELSTIENYEKRIPVAKKNFQRASLEQRITLYEGDAAEILKQLTGSYDLIFMDAAKGQYLAFLPEVVRLLAAGGLLVSDNVLRDGELIESRFAVTRRNRTIHRRMRDYLYELTHREDFVTTILDLGDGVALSVKQ